MVEFPSAEQPEYTWVSGNGPLSNGEISGLFSGLATDVAFGESRLEGVWFDELISD